ncbi:MAG: YkgJ family cysteine cluster protein [Dehalococcoidia bacterium]|nr:YkgJ family cysteine cluster protein [Dehalococcoidia bacterium]
MGIDTQVIDRVRAAWTRIEERWAAYDLHLPGSPSFICQAEACSAHCCKVYSVSLGERELERLSRFSGLEPVDLLETENGKPISLPLAQPYLLARDEGRCALLGDDLRCSQYHGRPEACRLYPHFVIFLNETTGRPVHGELREMSASMRMLLEGEQPEPYLPLLLRHIECPGFTGPPLPADAWHQLAEETFRLQYLPMQELKWR